MYNINEKIKFPWLNKQKMTEEIKKKYKNEKCSICLDEFSGDISISKAKKYIELHKNIFLKIFISWVAYLNIVSILYLTNIFLFFSSISEQINSRAQSNPPENKDKIS